MERYGQRRELAVAEQPDRQLPRTRQRQSVQVSANVVNLDVDMVARSSRPDRALARAGPIGPAEEGIMGRQSLPTVRQ